MISRDHLRRLHFINALFAGLTGDDRIAEPIGIVAGTRDSDGRWPRQNVRAGRTHVEMEDGEGSPSRWNTLRAMRVLQHRLHNCGMNLNLTSHAVESTSRGGPDSKSPHDVMRNSFGEHRGTIRR